MKFLLIVAAVVAMAVASPTRFKPVPLPGIIGGFEPISIGPALVDFPVPESALTPTPVGPTPVAATPSSSPLVQIIVNVKQQAEQTVPGELEVVATPVDIVEEEVIPTPVDFVEESDQVIVVEQPEFDIEPVNIAPIIIAPGIVGPEILN